MSLRFGAQPSHSCRSCGVFALSRETWAHLFNCRLKHISIGGVRSSCGIGGGGVGSGRGRSRGWNMSI